MHSFSMRPAKYFYGKPLPEYLDPKTGLTYRPHPVRTWWFWLSTERLSRSTLHLKEGERGVCTLLLCSLATVMSCIDASVRIVTKSPKVGPLLTVYSPSLWVLLRILKLSMTSIVHLLPYLLHGIVQNTGFFPLSFKDYFLTYGLFSCTLIFFWYKRVLN